MTIPMLSYLDTEGNLSSSFQTLIADDILLKAYATMVMTRLVDERMMTLQRQGVISFAMSSLGEEACAVASAAALETEDWMYPQYREAGIIFWRGFTPQQYIHHMFGDASDLLLGRQMPNHFGSKALNVVTVSSPIGTKIPHAAGAAYAMKILKESTVAICYFGEGATSEGDFHVGLNFAAVRKAPVIFFCRNNGYAISTPCSRQFATDGVVPEGIGHGIASFRVDGNDFFAVYEMVKKAREICLEQERPVLIEAMTFRMGAHSTSDDPSAYRKDGEVMDWQRKCPILRLGLFLRKKGLWSDEQQKKLEEKINQEITEGIKIAKETPRPHLKSIVEHVYFDIPASLLRQYDELKKMSSEGVKDA